ncbi:hypothetical protein MDA_GLEAN10011566 [Myotis davidii]|uniref:Prothymosin alpha n=1 Tax=Myotis davidii TaxID=225400 RepID=L5M7N8_MYODS|nr:hypothetical protein MDA_GLEAN10011566 [Myotis davidii]
MLRGAPLPQPGAHDEAWGRHPSSHGRKTWGPPPDLSQPGKAPCPPPGPAGFPVTRLLAPTTGGQPGGTSENPRPHHLRHGHGHQLRITTKALKKKEGVEEAESGRCAPANGNNNEDSGEQDADNEVDEEEEEGGEEEEEEEEEEEGDDEEEDGDEEEAEAVTGKQTAEDDENYDVDTKKQKTNEDD